MKLVFVFETLFLLGFAWIALGTPYYRNLRSAREFKISAQVDVLLISNLTYVESRVTLESLALVANTSSLNVTNIVQAVVSVVPGSSDLVEMKLPGDLGTLSVGALSNNGNCFMNKYWCSKNFMDVVLKYDNSLTAGESRVLRVWKDYNGQHDSDRFYHLLGVVDPSLVGGAASSEPSYLFVAPKSPYMDLTPQGYTRAWLGFYDSEICSVAAVDESPFFALGTFKESDTCDPDAEDAVIWYLRRSAQALLTPHLETSVVQNLLRDACLPFWDDAADKFMYFRPNGEERAAAGYAEGYKYDSYEKCTEPDSMEFWRGTYMLLAAQEWDEPDGVSGCHRSNVSLTGYRSFRLIPNRPYSCGGVSPDSYATCSKNGMCLANGEDSYGKCFCTRIGVVPGGFCRVNGRSIVYALEAVVITTLVSLCVGIPLTVVLCFVCARLRKKSEEKKRKEIWEMAMMCPMNRAIQEAGGDPLDAIMQEEQAEAVAKLQINESLFSINFEELTVKRSIGAGGSNAVVFQASWNGIDVAFKAFKLHDFLDQERFSEFEKEVKILASVSHPHILRFYGASLVPPRVGIIMAYCSNGDLKSYLSSTPETSLAVRVNWMIQICLAVNFLHHKFIIHRDMKCENVLLDQRLDTFVMDFGLSKMFDNVNVSKTTRLGTSYYMAPEIVKSHHYDHKVDVYSFGIMTYELLTLNFTPYGTKSGVNIEMRIASDPTMRPKFEDPEEEKKYPPYLLRIMRKCWDHDPDVRPEFSEIVEILKEHAADEDLAAFVQDLGSKKNSDSDPHSSSSSSED